MCSTEEVWRVSLVVVWFSVFAVFLSEHVLRMFFQFVCLVVVGVSSSEVFFPEFIRLLLSLVGCVDICFPVHFREDVVDGFPDDAVQL